MTIVALVRRLLRGPVKASVAICRHSYSVREFQYYYKRHRDHDRREIDLFIIPFVLHISFHQRCINDV